MAKNRELGSDVWYKVWTEVNVGEPLFRLRYAKTILYAALRDTKKRRKFEMCGLKIEGSLLSFYIKPKDGYELPKIMQWLKQTFSLWFNEHTGRKGHTWGERYESEIVAKGPPEDAEAVRWEDVNAEANKPVPRKIPYTVTWDSLRTPRMVLKTDISRKVPPTSAPPPA
jgi:hypothetical protein